MNANRDHFLASIWNRYPEAALNWLDVSSALKASRWPAVVCGRLSIQSGACFLSSVDARVAFKFQPVLSWLSGTMSVQPTPSLFRDGDLLALRFQNFENGVGGADQVLLLAPSMAQRPRRPGNFTAEVAIKWMQFLNSVREFFVSREFIEVQTPTLVPSPGTEPFLEPFETHWNFGSQQKKQYLPTSPEFHLKQLLACDWPRLFEIKSCFRNEELSPHHQPEFQMLEWYRAFASLDQIAGDVEDLLQFLMTSFSLPVAVLRRTTMSELFAESFSGFQLHANTTLDELRELAKQNAIAVAADDTFDDVFFRLFLEKIEPGLGADGPVLVRGYPPSQAALSRLDANGFADRFEVYWRGMELANAFHELNDPSENEARFRDDAVKKSSLRKRPVPRDENLVAAIRYGLPPSGGIALGLERLFMALMSLDSISDVRAFPKEQ